MLLDTYLKNEIKEINVLFKKDKCDKCGIEHGLSVHYDIELEKMRNETLIDLGLNYKVLQNNYSNEELTLIKSLFLSKYCNLEDGKSLTLCNKCSHKHEKVLFFLRMESYKSDVLPMVTN